MAFWNRFPYSNFHEINLDWIIREMKKISGSVSDFARQWEKALKQETGERQEADRQLQENIDAEQDRAEAAEEALGERIDQEIKDRQEADQAEQTAREEADKQLQANIEAETSRAEAAEEALDQKIEAETARATEKENDLQEQITAEVNRATAAEGTLDQKITAETSRATAAEEELDSKITAETSRATGVENELRGLITTETDRATAAEGALGDRIDGLEGDLEGVTGADSPFIRKDGSTTTTGKIPLAMGGTSETDPAAETDLVNLRSMQAADQALESSMTEYVDNQLESAMGDVHSIPAGGTTGQVLGKSSDADYAVQWVDQSGGGESDWKVHEFGEPTLSNNRYWYDSESIAYTTIGRPYDDSAYIAVERNWMTLYASQIRPGHDSPYTVKFMLEPRTDSLPTSFGRYFDNSGNKPSVGQVIGVLSNPAVGGSAIGFMDVPSGSDPDAIKKDGTTTTTARIPFAEGLEAGSSFITDNDIKLDAKNTFAIGLNGVFPHEGQVLTANKDGSCGWADAGGQASIIGSNDDLIAYRVGDLVLLYTNREFYYGITSKDLSGQSTLFNGYYYKHSESVSTANLGFVFPTTGDHATSSLLFFEVSATDLKEVHAFRVGNSITMMYRTMQDEQITATATVNMVIPDKTFIGSYVVPE